jgi:hypothetical protein
LQVSDASSTAEAVDMRSLQLKSLFSMEVAKGTSDGMGIDPSTHTLQNVPMDNSLGESCDSTPNDKDQKQRL